LGLKNLSFEQGLQNWVGEYKTDLYAKEPFSVVTDSATDGKHALRLAATKGTVWRITSSGTVSAYQEIARKTYEEKESWNLTYDVKLADLDDRDRIVCTLDYAREKKEGLGSRPYPFLVKMQDLPGGWLRAMVRVHLEGTYKKLRIGFRADADVLIDNLRLERAKGISSDTMYHVDPYQITINRGLEPKLAAEVFYNKELIRRAQTYNWLLGDMVFAKEKMAKLNRMSFYLGLGPDKALNARMDEVEKGVAELYDIYSKAYLIDRNMWRGFSPMVTPETKLILAMEFDPLAKTVRSRLAAHLDASDKDAERLREKARKAGMKWHTPPVVTEKPYRIRENGRPNQIIFPVWGRGNFHVEWALPLRLGKTHVLTTRGYHNPMLPDGRTVYSELDAGIAFLRSHGYKYYVTHGPVYSLNPNLGTDFYEKHQDNPDMFLKHRSRGVMSKARWYNWWQPEVRAQVDKVARNYCGGLKDRDEVLLLGVAGEVWNRDLGYSRPAVANFQKFLTKKYGTVEKLNKLWNTKYASFAEIEPQAKPYARGRGPLQIESTEWLDAEFIGWWKFIYDTIKKYAPNKLVISQHNQFAYGTDPAPFFSTVDIFGHHSSMDGFLAARQAVQSMNRFEKKSLGQ